jgi:hypothetical protein
MMTGISEAKLTSRDQVDVRLDDGYSVTESLSVTVRDFLHFGYFLLALRTAMDRGLLANHQIDHDRLRESWEPRREVLELKLCNHTPHLNH